jgi:hypothetical protein
MRHRLKVSALVLLVATLTLGQGTVPPNVSPPQNPQSDQDARIAAVPLVGRLEVHRGRTARVDNVDLEEGSTILDGQTIETSDCTSATVHLLPVGMISPTIVEVGQVDIASNSKVVINYSAGNIRATIERGCARVRSVTAIVSSISTPDGKLLQASGRDSLNRHFAETCYPSDKRESFDPTCVPPIVWILGGAGGIAAAVAAVGVDSRGENPSPPLPLP